MLEEVIKVQLAHFSLIFTKNGISENCWRHFGVPRVDKENWKPIFHYTSTKNMTKITMTLQTELFGGCDFVRSCQKTQQLFPNSSHD